MQISVLALEILVWTSLVVSAIAPIVLLTLFLRDRSRGSIW